MRKTSDRLIRHMPKAVFFVIAILPVLLLLITAVSDIGQVISDINSRTANLFLKSIRLSALSSALACTFGIIMAIAISASPKALRDISRLILFCAIVIPAYVWAIAWIDLAGPSGTLQAYISESLGLSWQLPHLWGFFGSLFLSVFTTVPICALLISSSIGMLEQGLIEASNIQSGWLRTQTHVVLPLCGKSIRFAAMLSFILTFSDFGVSSFFGYETFTVEIFSQLASFYNLKTASIYSILYAVVCIPLIALFVFENDERIYQTLISGRHRRYKTGSWALNATIYMTLTAVAFIYVLPIYELISQSLYWDEIYVGIQNYESALNIAGPNIITSIWIAVISSIIASMIGFSMALASLKQDGLHDIWADIITSVPFLIPGSVLGLGLIRLWNTPEIPVYGSPIIVLIAHIAKITLFTYIFARIGLLRVSKRIIDSKNLFQGSKLSGLLRITGPLALPALTWGLLISYIMSMRELSTTLMVYPPGHATLPVSLFILQHDGPPPIVASLSVIFIIITVAPYLLLLTYRGVESFTRTSSKKGYI